MTTHPALAEPIRSVSRIYDLQHDPNPGVPMTYPSPTSGEPVGLSFLIPHAPRHLVLRREVHRAWAEAGFGMLTRATDCLSTQVMAMAVDRDFFGENDPAFGDNVWKYYEYLRENDLFLTHARIDPQVERSKNRAQQRDPHLAVSVVDENDRGVVVRGAKMIATSAPYADEILIWPFGRFSPEESRYAILFAVPVATPGLRFVCRESFARPDALFAHPLASRFDEMDTVAVFDDVVVPWDRVFLKADIGVFNELDRRTHIRQYAAHQTAVRLVTKLEFVAGVIIQLAETIGIDSLLHVQDQIGEVLLGVATIRGLMTAGEANAAPGPGGALVPELEPLQAARLLGPQLYPRAIEILQVLGAGGLVASPSSERDLEGPLGDTVKRYSQGADEDPERRLRLFKLAWDLCGSDFGSRHVLFERYYGGDPVRLRAGFYAEYDRGRCNELVDRLIGGQSVMRTTADGGPPAPGVPAVRTPWP